MIHFDALWQKSWSHSLLPVRSFPQFWLLTTLTRTFLEPEQRAVKTSLIARSQSGVTMNLGVAAEAGQIEITFQYIRLIYRLQVGKITASVMQIYTVFEGTPKDKGSTFKYRTNLGVRTQGGASTGSRIITMFKLLTLSPSDLEPWSCKDFWRSSICCCNSRIRSLLSLL